MGPGVISSLGSSSLFWLFALCLALGNTCHAQCPEKVLSPAGDTVVCAMDAAMQYNPPRSNDSSVWGEISPRRRRGSIQGVQTSDIEANVSLTFQGNSLKLYAFSTSDYPPLLITLDGDESFIPGQLANSDQKQRMHVTNLSGSVIDSSIDHTVVVRKSPNASADASWNIVAFSFTPPSRDPPMIPTLDTTKTNPDAQSTVGASSAAISSPAPRTLSGSEISGIVIGSLVGVGLAVALTVCLRRRHRQMSEIPPEPLMVPPVTTRPDRSRFRRLNSTRLPHFTAPTSVWPSSTGRASTAEVPPMPAVRDPVRQNVTPFTLPAIPPKVVVPSPPRHPKTQKTRTSKFVIANPSSHSSRSIKSLSLKGIRRSGSMPVKDTSVDLLTSGDPVPLGSAEEKGIIEDPRPSRIDKGKQRVIDFDADPVPQNRPRMARKRSLHRFFFTTNPSPSTSSGSSTVSSKRSASMRKAGAVADYVRDQMRRRHTRRRHPRAEHPQMSTKVYGPVSIPEEPSSVVVPVPEVTPSRQAPRRSRTSQVRFFTTNPSPSIGDGASEREETNSVLTEIPPPRKDKGKARAF